MDSFLSDLGNSMIGSVKKAILIFGTNDGSGSSAGTPASSNIIRMTADKLNAGGLTNPNVIDTKLSAARYFEVQYNPASIQFSANADCVQMQNLQNSMEEGVISQRCRAPSVMMTVDLIFNEVNIKDSFMMDKFRVSVNDVVTDVAAAVTAAKGGYTVQPQSNGLLAATFDEQDRFVTFQWADMCFSGELTDVSVRYGMFSVSGKPVHSVVTLRIQQQLNTAADDAAWNQKKFDECFNGSKKNGVGQKVGNLLNITGF